MEYALLWEFNISSVRILVVHLARFVGSAGIRARPSYGAHVLAETQEACQGNCTVIANEVVRCRGDLYCEELNKYL